MMIIATSDSMCPIGWRISVRMKWTSLTRSCAQLRTIYRRSSCISISENARDHLVRDKGINSPLQLLFRQRNLPGSCPVQCGLRQASTVVIVDNRYYTSWFILMETDNDSRNLEHKPSVFHASYELKEMGNTSSQSPPRTGKFLGLFGSKKTPVVV